MPAGLFLSQTSTQTAYESPGLGLSLVTLAHFNIERALEQTSPGKELTELTSNTAALGSRAAEVPSPVMSV